ncbi:hypothetical protein LCI18_003334 [Fusarium solani-melongenae]|uniref:Uncharacterized protein n=1 Tax=Fusarium solani subsp. cucurbitae TaxID=2747967 RepID=A0ACD3YTW5_FUSSC|nr:hypothetical protein LCI18_003334 [Fusarium solani-melongenae]
MSSLRQSLVTLALAMPIALACVAKNSIPEATETISNNEPIEVAAGEVFDGKGARYDRGADSSAGQADTVFILREGATLRNVIIGPDQHEGVYCIGGGCTIENVWFEDVCEDAISIDAAGTTTNIIGGGAFHAADKVIQHNGCGAVSIKDVNQFYAEDYGKVYRACGTCDACKRDVRVEGVSAYGGGEVVGINTPCQLYDGPGSKAGEC